MCRSKLYYQPENNILLGDRPSVLKYDTVLHIFTPVRSVSKQEQRMLACMMAHENRLITREMLVSEVWGGRIVSDNTINVAISRLRNILRHIDPQDRCLRTIRNSGFIFSIRQVGAVPVISKKFLLASLNWAEEE